jgi:hypothetical protein
MSTIGFIGSTPADDAPLYVGQPYTFTIGIITDTAAGESGTFTLFTAGNAVSLTPTDPQQVGDSTSGSETSATFQVIPQNADRITVHVSRDSGGVTIADGTLGTRSYSAIVKPQEPSPRRRLSGTPFPKAAVELFGPRRRW